MKKGDLDKIRRQAKSHPSARNTPRTSSRSASILFSILVLSALAWLLGACAGAVESSPTPTLTNTFTPSITPSSTATPSPTPTLTPTPTPEPAWYLPIDPALGVLKYNYAEVLDARARVYVSLADAKAQTGNFGYLPKFPAYVVYFQSTTEGGQTYVQVKYGWMEAKQLKPLSPSKFAGILLQREIPFRFGWVLVDTQSVNAAGTPIQTYARYQVVHEVPALTQKAGFFAVGADEWLPEDALALVNPQVPGDVGANTCRFIHVNLAQQTLTVYDHCSLVFASLISSGANSWTFEGQFAILYKDRDYSTISPPPESTSKYYIEAVPYFMTYAGNFGFHGAYWHDNFGTAASHGCINLSPADAKWLYDWSGLGERVIISPGQ